MPPPPGMVLWDKAEAIRNMRSMVILYRAFVNSWLIAWKKLVVFLLTYKTGEDKTYLQYILDLNE